MGESLRPFVMSREKLLKRERLLYNDEKKESKSFLISGIIYGLNVLFGKGLINVDCHVNTSTFVTLKAK
jgi:hypothetical protein